MNPFVQQVLGAIVRAAIIWVAAQFGATLSDNQIVQIVAVVVPIVGTVAWSIYAKYIGRQKLLTAAASPKVLTENQVEAKVAAGDAPSVTTAKSVVPS